MNASFTLGRIFGIAIGVHYTWLIAFALITWTLAVGFFPTSFPGWSQVAYWITGAIAAIGLFVSVLVHELAHSLVAIRRGVPVQSITLFIFGGVSNLQSEASKARDEFLISIVGPLSSILIGLVSFLLFFLIYDQNPLDTQTSTSPVAAIIFYLALINVILGVFNMLPGFPLDGGRVLRSIVWASTGSLSRATIVAANVGRVVSFGFIGLGVFQILTGSFLAGLWIAFIGWFLNNAADASRRDVETQERLRGVPVSIIMERDPQTVGPTLTIADLVSDVFIRRGLRAVPVFDGALLQGIVTLSDVRAVPAEKWSETTVADIMTRAPLHTVAPGEGLASALRLLAERDVNQLLALENGRLIGLVSRADVIRYLQFRDELGR